MDLSEGGIRTNYAKKIREEPGFCGHRSGAAGDAVGLNHAAEAREKTAPPVLPVGPFHVCS
jgi:hypothetical protein